MASSRSFNVTLSSEDCAKLYPGNHTANFKVRLPRQLNLNETWRVGLADVTFNNSRFTFDRGQKVAVRSDDKAFDSEVVIAPALYESIEMLIAEINKQVAREISIETVPKLEFSEGKVSVKNGYYTNVKRKRISIGLEFSTTLKNILGIDRWGIPSLNARQPIIFVYSDIVKKRVVGDVAVRLLRTIDPSKGRSFGSIVSLTFRNIYFCRLDVYDVREIELQLLDDTGLEPLFKYGSFRVTLQFRQFK